MRGLVNHFSDALFTNETPHCFGPRHTLQTEMNTGIESCHWIFSRLTARCYGRPASLQAGPGEARISLPPPETKERWQSKKES